FLVRPLLGDQPSVDGDLSGLAVRRTRSTADHHAARRRRVDGAQAGEGGDGDGSAITSIGAVAALDAQIPRLDRAVAGEEDRAAIAVAGIAMAGPAGQVDVAAVVHL